MQQEFRCYSINHASLHYLLSCRFTHLTNPRFMHPCSTHANTASGKRRTLKRLRNKVRHESHPSIGKLLVMPYTNHHAIISRQIVSHTPNANHSSHLNPTIHATSHSSRETHFSRRRLHPRKHTLLRMIPIYFSSVTRSLNTP